METKCFINKKWSYSLFFLFFFFSGTLFAKIPQSLLQLEKTYQAKKTLFALFKQTIFFKTFGKKKQTEGKIWIAFPHKIRWEVLKPDPELFISNGKKSWFYTPPFDPEEPGQVLIRKTQDLTSKFLQALLSGAFSKIPHLRIQAQGNRHFLLFPKKGTAADVYKVQLVLSSKNVIQEVTLWHIGGNRSKIVLQNIHLGLPISHHLFVFQSPPGTVISKP